MGAQAGGPSKTIGPQGRRIGRNQSSHTGAHEVMRCRVGVHRVLHRQPRLKDIGYPMGIGLPQGGSWSFFLQGVTVDFVQAVQARRRQIIPESLG